MSEQRSRIYYHPSQVSNNLFTNGKEWMILDNWGEYIGTYHQYITGETYTESEWNPLKSKRLIRYKERSKSYFKYVEMKQYFKNSEGKRKPKINAFGKYGVYTKPEPVIRIPTSDEFKQGKMTRHFAYKRNEPGVFFVEIGPNQKIDYFRDGAGINQYLYDIIDVSWKLNGPEYDTFNDRGILISSGVVDTNKRIILRISKKLPIFVKIVTDPRQFTIYDNTLKLF
jgi:hypothetical protein